MFLVNPLFEISPITLNSFKAHSYNGLFVGTAEPSDKTLCSDEGMCDGIKTELGSNRQQPGAFESRCLN